MTMTTSERTAMLKMVARSARVAAADVDQLAAERLAEFERQATKEWGAADVGAEQIAHEANERLGPALREIETLIAEHCDAHGIEPELRPRVVGGVHVISSFVTKDRRADLRRRAKAEIESARKRAKVEIERRRGEIESAILVTGIESEEGKRLLASLPAAAELVPVVTLDALTARYGEVNG